MPIVLSYNDVNALGTLAQGAGEAERGRFEQQLLQRYDTSRDATAANLQGIEARERQAAYDRQFRGQQSALERAFTTRRDQQQLAAQERRSQRQAEQTAYEQDMRMRRALLDAGLDQQQDAVGYQRDMDLMDRRHQQRLQEIAARAAYRGSGGTSGGRDAAGDPIDVEKRAEAEANQFSNLIPFNARATTRTTANQVPDLMEQAKHLAMLPNAQLREMLQNAPNDEWARYIQKILQNRQQAESGDPIANSGGPARARRRSGLTRGATPGATSRGGGGGVAGERGQGFGSTGLEDLSDEQLMQFSQNPQRLQRYLQEGQR